MSRLRVASIVEGHGEVIALPLLLRRVWLELLGGGHIDVLQPIRGSRGQLMKVEDSAFCKYVQLAANQLAAKRPNQPPMPELVLVLVDAEDDMACELGPTLLQRARKCRSDVDVVSVIANHCYETWFVAAADSLRAHLDLSDDSILPNDPETEDLRKSWVAERIRRAKYSETADQPRLTGAMDLRQCRANSRSFDKLCRELEGRLHTPTSH